MTLTDVGSEDAKRLVAEHALRYLPPAGIVGLGTGSTARFFIDGVGRLVKEGRNLVGVATSNASREQAQRLQIPLLEDAGPWPIDVCVDGADEVNTSLQLIKGLGAALLREKVVNASARYNIILVEQRKLSARLAEKCRVPIEVARFGHGATGVHLAPFGQATLRRHNGAPTVTDGGNYIYDLKIAPDVDPAALQRQLKEIPGVLETGLFVRPVSLVLVADGPTVRELRGAGAPPPIRGSE